MNTQGSYDTLLKLISHWLILRYIHIYFRSSVFRCKGYKLHIYNPISIIQPENLSFHQRIEYRRPYNALINNENVALPITKLSTCYYVNFLKCLFLKVCIYNICSQRLHFIELRKKYKDSDNMEVNNPIINNLN